MKFTSQIVAGASGSVRGLVASHNKGGQYFRGRSIPTNPQTAFQQQVRNSMAMLTSAWSQILTALQRQGWNDYAANVPTTDSLGNKIQLTGLNWYVACNVPRLQCGLTRVDAPPTTFTLASLTNPTLTSFTASTRVLVSAYTNTDAWAIATGGALAYFISQPQSPGINFFKGPYRFLGKVLGNTGTPPTSPFTSAAGPFPTTAGNQVFVFARALNADGRISSPFRAGIISV